MPYKNPADDRAYRREYAQRKRDAKKPAGLCTICTEKAVSKRLCARHIRKRRRYEREVREAKKGAPLRAYQPWTAEVVAELVEYRRQGYTTTDIAELMDRTVYTVRQQVRRLGLARADVTMHQQRWLEAFRYYRTHAQVAAKMETTVRHSRQMLCYLRRLGFKVSRRKRAKVKKRTGPRGVLAPSPGLSPDHPWRKGWGKKEQAA